MDFMDLQSTGQDDEQRRKLVEDAVKAKRWSLIPQAIAGIGDTLSAANRVYGGGGNTGAQAAVNQEVAGNIADTQKQFESSLQTDPMSDASKQYQNLLGKFLGKDPTSFANMSASQIKDQIPAIEKLSTIENQKELKKQTMTQQAQNHADSEANRKLQFEALQQNRGQLNEDRDAKRDLQEQQQKETKVQKYSENIEKEQLPELLNAYNRLFDPVTSGKDIAGVGVLASHLPNLLVSGEGISNREDLQKIANVVLKRRSGAAVTDPEYARFLKEVQGGSMPTEQALKLYYNKLGSDFKASLGQLEAGLPPEALQEYKSRPGAVTTESIKTPEASTAVPASTGEVKRKTKDGKIAIFDSVTKQFKRYE